MAVAAGALVFTGTTAAITAGLAGTTPPPVAVSSSSVIVPLDLAAAAGQGLTATGTLASHPWGTQISCHCSCAPAVSYRGPVGSQNYVFVVVSDAGLETTVASWTAGPGSDVSPTAATGTPASAIARLEIRDSKGSTLLSVVP